MSDANANLEVSESNRLGIPSWVLLCTIAVVPVVFATGFSEFGAVKEYVLVAGVGLALAVWGVQAAWRGRVSLAAGRVVSLALAAAFYVALSVTWGPEPLYSTVSAGPLLALIGVVLILSAPIERPVRFVEFGLAVAVGTGLVAITGLLDLAGVGIFTFIWDPPGATGAFDAMEFGAAYYAVALPVAVAGTDYVDDWRRIVFGLASTLGAAHFGLVADWTFFGLFATACAAVALIVLYFEGVETATVLIPIAALVGMVLLVNIVAASAFPVSAERTDATALPYLSEDRGITQQELADRQPRNPKFSVGRTESVRSMEEREYLATVAFELFQEQPLIGHGPGSWWRLQTKAPNMDHPAVQKRFRHYPAYRSPHSVWSRFAVEFGVIGMALFVLWVLGCAAVGLGAMGRSAEHADLIIEQWGLWATGVAGLLFATFTPLVEVAPAALVWFGAVGMLTRRSAEVNRFEGASQRWVLGGEESASPVGRGSVAVVATVLGLGLATLMSFDLISRLYRGWGDQLMLRTYYNRAVQRYQSADDWLPVRGGVVYNQALAQSRLGVLTRSLRGSAQEREGGRDWTGPGTPESVLVDAGSAMADAGDRGEAPPKGSEGPPSSESKAGEDSDAAPPTGATDSKRGAGGARRGTKSGKGTSEKPPGMVLLERALEMRPYDARVLDLMAQYQLTADAPRAAIRHGRRAVEANPNSVPARKTLAAALRTIGKFDAAAKQLQTVLDRNPPRGRRYELHVELAGLYMNSLGEFEHARDHLQAAKRAAEGFKERDRVEQKLSELKEKVQRQRRKREGKPPKPPGSEGGSGPPGFGPTKERKKGLERPPKGN